MLVFNQQANIKNVNGAIADILANRPAPQSTFYIFYSTDTQEIYYDNGAWILLGSGGGGGVNIYNSDGTLTGNRRLFGDNYFLRFQNLNEFRVQNVNFNYDLVINQTSIQLQSINLKFDLLNTINVIKTQYQSNDIGLKLDFANSVYQFGQITGGNTTYFEIDDVNQTILTFNQGNQKGIGINFATNQYYFGNASGLNNTFLQIDDNAGAITTNYNSAPQGLSLTFTNSLYKFGQITGGNTTFFEIDDLNQIISTNYQSNRLGLEFDYNTNIFKIGDVNNVANFNQIIVEDTNNQIYLGILSNLLLNIDNANNVLKTQFNTNDVALKLDFANNIFYFGDTNISYCTFNCANGQLFLQSQNYVEIGVISGTALISFNDSTQIIKTFSQGLDMGWKLDFLNTIYKFGQIVSGNSTYLTIDDAAAYPVQIDGTNVLSGSSAGSSGQHLKIKINGTDYKIKLENP